MKRFAKGSLGLQPSFSSIAVKAGMREKKKGKVALLQTTEDFAERTSIHGISYVFDRGLWIADRLLWAVLVICFLGLAFCLTWNSWTQWRDEQVSGIISKNMNYNYNVGYDVEYFEL